MAEEKKLTIHPVYAEFEVALPKEKEKLFEEKIGVEFISSIDRIIVFRYLQPDQYRFRIRISEYEKEQFFNFVGRFCSEQGLEMNVSLSKRRE